MYEFTVETRCDIPDDDAERLVRQALASDPCGFYPSSCRAVGRENNGPVVFATGIDDDWCRSHEDRHRVVREAVVALIPSAKLMTSWLDLGDVVWDDTIDDTSDDGEAESREVAS